MPGSLDSCINNVFEAGFIPASSGLPPVRVLLKNALEAALSETTTAVDAVAASLDTGIEVDVVETATATDDPSAALLSEDWVLVDSWTHSGDVANVDFIGLAGYTEIHVALRNVSATVSSAIRQVLVSTNNGSTFLSSSGDYIRVEHAGTETNASGIATFSSIASAGALRSGDVIISGWNLTAIKTVDARNRTASSLHWLIPASSALNALRINNDVGGNLSAGSIYVYAR